MTKQERLANPENIKLEEQLSATIKELARRGYRFDDIDGLLDLIFDETFLDK